MINQSQLSEFCLLANASILEFYDSRASCIFSTAVVCEVLNHFGIQAAPLRVKAVVWPADADPRVCGCTLGSDGNGTRMPAAHRDCWHGHLVSLVQAEFLVDTTLDQANDVHPYLAVSPCAIYSP